MLLRWRFEKSSTRVCLDVKH